MILTLPLRNRGLGMQIRLCIWPPSFSTRSIGPTPDGQGPLTEWVELSPREVVAFGVGCIVVAMRGGNWR